MEILFKYLINHHTNAKILYIKYYHWQVCQRHTDIKEKEAVIQFLSSYCIIYIIL